MIDTDERELKTMYNKLLNQKVTFTEFEEFIREIKDEWSQRGYDQAQETYSCRSNY